MVAGADGDSLGIGDGAEVVGVKTVDVEGDDADLVRNRAVDAKPGDAGKRALRPLQQRALVLRDGVPAKALHEVDRSGQAHRASDVRSAGLETGWRIGVGGAFEADAADHVAAALIRRHRGQHLGAAPEHTDAGGAVELVTGENIEVATQRLHVHRQMRHGLRAIDQHRHAACMGKLRHARHIVDGAQYVRDMGDGQHARARPEQLRQGLQVERAVVADRRHAQFGTGGIAHHLPGHDVGMVLHRRHQHLVAGLQARPCVALCDQIDRFGGATHEHDLVGAAGVDKGRNLLPRGLEGVGGALRQRMDAAVDVGVIAQFEGAHGVEHGQRFLRRRRIVQIHQRLAVHRLGEDGEMIADRRKLRRGTRWRFKRIHAETSEASIARPRRAASRVRTCARKGSQPMSGRACATKACTSRARASGAAMPRDCR